MKAPAEVHDHPSGAKRCSLCGTGMRAVCSHCDVPHDNPKDELDCLKCKPLLSGFRWAGLTEPRKKGWWRR